jgi:hypothetical protein
MVSDEQNEVTTNNEVEYDAPKIEEVVTAGRLEREVQYAGFASGLAL